MKPRCSHRRNQALSITEVVVVIVCMLGLAAVVLILPVFARPGSHRRPACLNNLNQIGSAVQVWAIDHNDKYPMQVSTANWGASELTVAGDVAGIFRTMSNYLYTPKYLYCPQDRNRTAAADFGRDFNRTHVSYFVGIDVERKSLPQMILAGDDNLLVAGKPVQSGILNLATNVSIEWTKGRVKKKWREGWLHGLGNLALAGGSVWAGWDDKQLAKKWTETGLATNRLAIP